MRPDTSSGSVDQEITHPKRRFTGSSYAQNFEDVYIARAFNDVAEGFYIDVGAYHPEFDSVTKLFYDHGWSGINVEPGPNFALFVADRPRDINIQSPIAGSARDVLFFYHPDAPGTSSILPALPCELSDVVKAREPQRMRAQTLETLIATTAEGRHIHFIKLDCEGLEGEIIAATDWTRIRPELLIVESTLPNTHERVDEAWRQTLLDALYVEQFFDGINVYYLRQESLHRAHAFRWPVNALDALFKPDYGAKAVIWRLEQERDQARTAETEALAALEAERGERASLAQAAAQTDQARTALEQELAAAAGRHAEERHAWRSQLSEAQGGLQSADDLLQRARTGLGLTPAGAAGSGEGPFPPAQIVERVQAFVDECLAHREALTAALDATHRDLGAANQRIGELEALQAALTQDIARLNDRDAQTTLDLKTATDGLARLQAANAGLERAIAHVKSRDVENTAQLDRARSMISNLQSRLSVLEADCARLTDDIAEKTVKLEQASTMIADLTATIAGMGASAQHLRVRSRAAEAQCNDLTARLQDSVAAYDALAQSHTSKVLEGVQLQNNLQVLKAERVRFLETLHWPEAPKALKYALPIARLLRAMGNSLARRRFFR